MTVEVMMVSGFTLPWLPRKGLAKTGVRKEPSPKKRCIVYLKREIIVYLRAG